MQSYDVERSLVEGREAVEGLFEYIRENAGKLDVDSVERAVFRMVLGIGLPAMKAYFAKRGTGDLGASIRREDGTVLKRESRLRSRDYFSIFGKFDVPRTCYRKAKEPGIFPLDEQVNFPKRCYSYFLQEWMTMFAVEHPFQESGDLFEQLFGLDIAESVVKEVAMEAQDDYDAFYDERVVPPIEEGDILVAGFDGKGVPMIKAEAAKLVSKLGTGEKRQRKKESVVGVCYTVQPKLRTAEELAEQLIEPEAARARRQTEGRKDDPPRAKNVRRLASLERTKDGVMEMIREDAERRDPHHQLPLAILLDGDLNLWRKAPHWFKKWTNVQLILDIMHVVSYLWLAANALFGEQSDEGRRWVQNKLIEILKGRVGFVIGSLKLILAKRDLSNSKQKALRSAVTYLTNHKAWMKYDEYLSAGLPVATGVVESTCGSLVKHRMEGNGKRWSMEGAEAILLLRSLKKSHSNDLREYWKYRAMQERHYLYEAGPQWRPDQHLKVVGAAN